MEWLKTVPIAHRGFHTETSPENSMPAFLRAVEEGFTIELDVRLTKDQQVVVFHDANLKRMTGLSKNVSECSYEEIQHLKLCYTKERIPLLEEVLEQINGKVPLLIEIKNKRRAGALERKTNELLQAYSGNYAIQSFNPFTLGWFKKNSPGVIRGLLVGDLTKEKTFSMKQKLLWNKWLFLKMSQPHFINYDLYSANYIPKFIRENTAIIRVCWTAVSKQEYQQALAEFDNVIFERFHPHQ
ncbi:glycerophosphodiester phosphodiesterase family protein [Bacillus solitudinis]|uniref:glycerophosphodiester phosphodiesterase family protein n=1 Tax=Bacillus solitudinis TaxID=2014074 RepID=UPI000C23DC7D|nr:glycerophosphodiester phosphodiesterase family protein [Bacillus solitudinis]